MPSSFQVHLDLGLLLAKLAVVPEALAHLERAAEIGPPARWRADVRAEAVLKIERKIEELRGFVGPSAPAGE